MFRESVVSVYNAGKVSDRDRTCPVGGIALNLEHLIVGPLQVNCFIISDGATNEAAVIDAGGNAAQILAVVKAHGLNVTRLLNTHAHFDHVLAVAEIKAATGASFLLHKDDQPTLVAVPQQVQLWLTQEAEMPPKPDRFYQEGDTVQIGRHTLRVLDVPGHSPGSIALVDDENQRVFSGDALFAGSIGRTDIPGGDMGTLLTSIREKLFPLGDAYQVLPGHGPFTTIGHERETNPFFASYGAQGGTR